MIIDIKPRLSNLFRHIEHSKVEFKYENDTLGQRPQQTRVRRRNQTVTGVRLKIRPN